MKKVLSILLSVIMFTCLFNFTSTYAVNDNEDDVISEESGGSRYSYIAAIYASIAKGSLGFVTCTSSFTVPSTSYTIVLTCILQRTDGSEAWSNYKSKSETFTGTSTDLIEKSWYAPSGYAYRTYTKVVVKNSSGTVLETEHIVSNVLYK